MASGLKNYVDELEKEFGSVTEVSKALDVPRQSIRYWQKSGRKLQELLNFLERSRRKTKRSKSALWDAVVEGEK